MALINGILPASPTGERSHVPGEGFDGAVVGDGDGVGLDHGHLTGHKTVGHINPSMVGFVRHDTRADEFSQVFETRSHLVVITDKPCRLRPAVE